MSDTNSNTELRQDPSDPLGFLILPIFGILLVAALLLWFNQKEEEVVQKFFPVTGRVTLEGEPLSGLFHVDFYPVEGSSNPVASSWIDQDGNFDLYSGTGGDYGAMPGEYIVVFSLMEGDMQSFRIEAFDNGFLELDPVDGGTMTPPDPDPPFDARYKEVATSPQRAIIGETENVINFDLPLFKKTDAKAANPSKKNSPTPPNLPVKLPLDASANVKKDAPVASGPKEPGGKKGGTGSVVTDQKIADPKIADPNVDEQKGGADKK